jgi:ABC-type cobalamin/Fe3+-siderophores transport system ATPase subunit
MDRQLILDVSEVTYRYPRAAEEALHHVSLAVAAGELVALLGPNGSGKTTLVRLALGLLPAQSGAALVLGRPADQWSRRDLARRVGVVAQREDNLFPQRVGETVRLGRYPHLGPWASEGPRDREAVAHALARCDVAELTDRWLWSLSGGEYQRVRIARALAQEPELLVLDEPTTSLDVRHEMELFELVRDLVSREGLGALLVTHDVNLAARFADRLVLLSRGTVAAAGAPGDVLRREVVEEVFGWPVTIGTFDDRPQIIPLRRNP